MTTRAFKRRFIRELVRNVEKDILKKVPEMPQEWDGHELRCLIADKFEEAAFRFYMKQDRRRARDYRNAVITKNL